MRTMGDDLKFTIKFSPNNARRFVDLAGRDRVLFLPMFRHFGRKVEWGELKIDASIELARFIESFVSSSQRSPDAPIFQSQVNQAGAEMQARIRRDVYMTDPSVYPLLEPTDIVARVFERVDDKSWEDARTDPVLAAQIYEYLMPHLRELNRSEEISVINTESEEFVDTSVHTLTNEQIRERIDRIKIQGGIGVEGGPSAGVEGEREKKDTRTRREETQDTQQKMRRWSEETGVKLVQGETETEFRPHSIAVFRRREGQETLTFREATRAHLILGETDTYEMDSGTPISLTPTVFEALTADRPELQPYTHVPVGSVLPFFGQIVPQGWVLLDGTTVYPDAAWVPEHLRGKPVPDLTALGVGGFLGSAPDLAAVGTIHVPKPTTLSFPEQKTSLQMQALGLSLRVSSAEFRTWREQFDEKLIDVGTVEIGEREKVIIQFNQLVEYRRGSESEKARARERRKRELETKAAAVQATLRHSLNAVSAQQQGVTSVSLRDVTPSGILPRGSIRITPEQYYHIPAHIQCRWIMRIR